MSSYNHMQLLLLFLKAKTQKPCPHVTQISVLPFTACTTLRLWPVMCFHVSDCGWCSPSVATFKLITACDLKNTSATFMTVFPFMISVCVENLYCEIWICVAAKCSAGQYSDTGLAPCAPCPRNFFQPQHGQTTCFECPTNTRTGGPGAVGREECEPIQCTDNACQHGGLCVPMGT